MYLFINLMRIEPSSVLFTFELCLTHNGHSENIGCIENADTCLFCFPYSNDVIDDHVPMATFLSLSLAEILKHGEPFGYYLKHQLIYSSCFSSQEKKCNISCYTFI